MQNFTWEMSSYFADFPVLQVQDASTYQQHQQEPFNSLEPTGVSEGRQSFAPQPIDISMITEERTASSALVPRDSLAMSDISVVGNLVQQIGPCS